MDEECSGHSGTGQGSRCPIHGQPPPPPTPRKQASPCPLPKSATMRQHYYPEGGWGWLICACAFVVQLLTTGLQLAYGVLYLHAVQHFGHDYVIEAGWLGAFSMSVSHFLSPCVVAVCQRKSTRLTAVFGGLTMALACLFTSFAQQMHQTFVSYGLVLGLGVGMCRETSNLMVGQYFKRRREVVEVIALTGSGIGAAIFSVLFKEAIGAVGWRLGLQAVTGVLFTSFVVGTLYRSASLYHPQRRAILHLKYQKKKVKGEKGAGQDKPPYVDLSTLKTRTLRIIMVSTGISSLGVYAPVFYLALHCKEEGLDLTSIVTLQTFLGFAFALGSVGFGLVVIRQSDQCFIGRQYLVQASLAGLAMAILALATIKGYHSYVLFVWMYGLFLGGYHFSLKVLTYEKVRARQFGRAWGFVQWAKALPVLFGVPITGYINRGESSKVGFYFASAFTLVGGCCLFLMNLRGQRSRRRDPAVTFSTIESRVIPPYVHSLDAARAPPIGRLGPALSFATSADGQCRTLAEGQVTFDEDEYYEGCDCITSCDKVERAFVFSEYENDLREEEGAGPKAEVGGAVDGWGVASDCGRCLKEPMGGAEGGADARGGVNDFEWTKKAAPCGDVGGASGLGRGKQGPPQGGANEIDRMIKTPTRDLGGANGFEWSKKTPTRGEVGGANGWGRGSQGPGGGVNGCGGACERERRANDPLDDPMGGANHRGGANGWGRCKKGPIGEALGGGASARGVENEWGRGKKELMTSEALVEEEEEEQEEEAEVSKTEREEEVASPEVDEEAEEEEGACPLGTQRAGRGRGRGGRTPRGRRRSSITVVEEMTTSV